MSRWIFISLGLFFVVLAAAGVALPGLPTTPFLLLAAACFAKSSPRLYSWLLANKVFGPIIVSWRENRTMPRRAKQFALMSIVLTGAISVTLMESGALQFVLVLGLMIPLIMVSRIRVAD